MTENPLRAALEQIKQYRVVETAEYAAAIVQMRQIAFDALAQQAAPEQKPVAWLAIKANVTKALTYLSEAETWEANGATVTPLYTIAQQAAPEQATPEGMNVEGLLDDALYNWVHRADAPAKRQRKKSSTKQAVPEQATERDRQIRNQAIQDCRNCYSHYQSAHDWDYSMAQLLSAPSPQQQDDAQERTS